MIIDKVEMHLVELPLRSAFETSVSRDIIRPLILINVLSEEISGWGESSVDNDPWYSYETTETAWYILKDYLIPNLLGKELSSPYDVNNLLRKVKGHLWAKSGLENALWDWFAKRKKKSLSNMLGGNNGKVSVGVSVGIEEKVEDLLNKVEGYVEEGYNRIKVKIKPGWDIKPVSSIRKRWDNICLQVDANCSFSLKDIGLFKELDQYSLGLIEQPFHEENFLDHATLQSQIKTPICLDDSITSIELVKLSISLNSCKIINIKPGRLGGLANAKEVNDYCFTHGIPVWCGGMLESNIGRAHNLALASLSNFSLPSDISASSRYYKEDIAYPNFLLREDSTIDVPESPGIGVDVDVEKLKKFRVRFYRTENENGKQY